MKRLAWLINRIRVMSAREVLFRLQRTLVQTVERYRVAAGWQPLPAGKIRPRLVLFGTDPGITRDWQQSFQLDTDRLHDYMAGRINFFGHDALDIGMPVVWNRDPVTRTEAPRVFGKSINYRDDRLVGNVKFTWELGRHQHLVPLAVAYAVTGDTRYREAVVGQVDGWIDDNPYAIGIHWCSALEVSLRLVSWALIHSLLALRDGEQGLFASVRDPERLGTAIYQQVWFVRNYLSRYSSANNHLIGELCGLWVACRAFDLGEQGDEWASFAQKELEREARLQVYADGVDREQAAYYHLWVLEYFLCCWLVGERSGAEFSAEFAATILAMTRFLEDICPDDGEPPQLGDADDGFVARFGPSWSQQPYRELLLAVHAVFGKVDHADTGKAFWYRSMLPSGKQPLQKLDWHRSYPVVYPQGGYIVMGGEGYHLVFDAGPLGYLGIAAHGHADALSFCLAIDGAWWLVDPGTYAYHSAPEWRSYFRGTSAHNTIRVNRNDQSQMGGAFLWLHKARATVLEFKNNKLQYVKACHDGYRADGITHVRELSLNPQAGEIEVIDTLEGNPAEVAEIFFHFAPDIQLLRGPGDNCWVATRQGSQRQLTMYMDPAWSFDSFHGSTDPILGWYSVALEEKMPAGTLRGLARESAARSCVTRIVITGSGRKNNSIVKGL
jgi:Heparinase II/III-like protein/Heparinase II/III N-terminus